MTSAPRTCELCNETDIQGPIESHNDAGVEYALYRCNSCLAEFWWPFKNPGSAWYERDERYADRNSDPILQPNEKHLAVTAFFKGQEGVVLDAGCGVGNFLAHAVTQGWKGWGIDFDHDAIAAGKKAFGLTQLEVADLSEFHARHPGMQFDLITYFDVFEHLDNHQQFIQDVSALLVPGGSVALSMPYRNGWRWLMQADLPPRHLTRWDEESIRRFYERHGFTISKIVKFPASFSFLLMKIRFRYGKWASIGLMRKVKKSSASVVPAAITSAQPPSAKMRAMHLLARAKDIVLFGIPAGILWLGLLFTNARHTDFLCIAKKNS